MDTTPAYVRRHLAVGWWSLLLFLSLGASLEVMHGFKLGFYLSVANDTRRLMWTLAHAHGTLLSIVHIAFAATVGLGGAGDPAWRRAASKLLIAAGILLPLGFFLGGLVVWGGDPWIGVLLVPLAAVLLFLGVLLTAGNVARS